MTLGKHDIPIGYYCGPSAIMLLTGREYEEVRSAINKVRGFADNRGVIRVYAHHLIEAVQILGYEITRTQTFVRPVPLRKVKFEGHWIVRSSGHFMAVVDGEVAENGRVWWTPVEQSPSAGRRITHAWKLREAA